MKHIEFLKKCQNHWTLFRISEPVEQHSFIGFYLHCRSVSHTADQWSSTAAMVFTCTASRVLHRRASGAAQLHWFSPALQVGSAPPEQWSSTAALVFTCTAGRSALPDQWSSTAALVFICTAGQFRTAEPFSRGLSFRAATSCLSTLRRTIVRSIAGPAATHKGPGTIPPEEPPQPSRPQGSAASVISNAVAEGGHVERESGNWCL
jgi:hypothetical protein